VRRALLGIALAGCYGPTVNPGGACESSCPGDLTCVDHVCRLPGYVGDGPTMPPDGPRDAAPPIDTIDAPDAPPGDADGDGKTDNLDNCPTRANADQHDEDGDLIGDVCDPCPHLAGNAADGDGDGVGDACDPQPSIAKQHIKFFDPLTTAKPEWSLFGGASRVGETIRFNGTTSGADLNVANGETRFVIGGTIAAIGSSLPHQVSVSFGESVSSVYHYVEFWENSTTQGSVAVSKANNGTYTTLTQVNYTAPMPTGAWSMQVDSSVAAQTIRLAAKLGGTPYAPALASTSTSPSLTTGTSFSFYFQNVDVRLDYVVVIETMP
jgi:hypothetical protein